MNSPLAVSSDFVRFSGVGLHSGQHATVKIRRGKEGSGYCFQTKNIWRASLERVVDTEYRTVLSDGVQSIQTVEHLLSALYGLGISDALIEVQGDEIPILDGSALPFTEKLKETDFGRSPDIRKIWTPSETVSYINSSTGAQIIYRPGQQLRIIYHLMKNGKPVLSAEYIHSPESFVSDIAPARTFAFYSDLKKIKNQKLISGIRADCGFIVLDSSFHIDEIARITGIQINRKWFYEAAPYPVISKEFPRFTDEAIRHKILDLLGDLALSGKQLSGSIEAWGTGHSDHIAFLRQLNLSAQ